MNLNEILKKLQQKKKDNKTGVILIFIASVLAFMSAIYSAFQFGKKKGVDEYKELRAGSASGSNTEEQLRAIVDEIKTVIYKAVAPQPTYVVRPLEEKKIESRGRRFRRRMYAVASVLLVISLVGSATMQYVEPTTSLAKDSFSGIGKIVDDHDDKPYKILDIVPADAIYTLASDPDDSGVGQSLGTYTFSLGTMGYLVDGQAPVISDLEEGFKENKAYSYDERQKLTDTIFNSGTTLGVTYQEAYPGVDTISESAGWIQIFDQMDVPSADGDSDDNEDDDGNDDESGADSLTYATGQFYGKYEEAKNHNGDYTAVSPELRKAGLFPDSIYELHEGAGFGDFRLSFKLMDGSEDMVGGYIAHEKGDMSSNSFSHTTCVYEEVSPGVYRFVGTIGDLIGHGYNINSGKKPEGTKPAEPGTSASPSEGGNTTPSDNPPVEGGNTTSGDNPPVEGDTTPGDNPPVEGGDTTPDDNPPVEGGDTTPDDNTPAGDGNTTTDGNGDAPVGDPAVNDISEPVAKAIVFTDGWRLLVEGEDDEATSENENQDNGNTTPDSGDTGGNGNPNPDNNNVTPDGGDTGDNNSTPGGNPPVEGGGTTPTDDIPTENIPSYEEPPSYDDGGSTDYYDDDWSDEDINWEDYAGYKIVVFEYVEEPWEGAVLYKVDGVEEINLANNVPGPYDSYDVDYPISTLAAGNNLRMVSTDGTTITAPDWEFVYTPNKGDYNLVRLNKNDKDAKLIEVQGVPVYFRCKGDNDWLKEYVFSSLSGGNNESDKFKIEVTTMLASDVQRSDVRDADLIFLESGDSNTVLNMNALSKRYIVESHEDMSEDALTQIVKDAVEDSKPVIVDYGIVEDEEHYKNSNYQYLAKAFLKSDLEGFYEEMNKGGKLLDNLKTNKNVDDSKEFPNKDDNDYHYVNRNVYIINDTPLVSEDFPDRFDRDTERAGFSEVLNAIRAENTTLSEDDQISDWVSKARAVQYIINYSVGIIGEFEDLKILEIQPSANLKPDLYMEDGNTKLVWKTKSMTTAKQILSSKKEFHVDIDVKSVAQFNSEWEDINGIYDMIFIGLDGQRLNLDDDGKAVYNSSDLDGKVYHKGDNSDSGLGKYDANDLTGQKMEDLLEFLEAGYPIVVENNCFEEGSAQDSGRDGINHNYIEEGSVMDYFLQTAVSDNPYYDYIFSVSDVTSNAMFMTQMRISKPRVSLVDENGEEASKLQALSPDENGEYHGQIYYKIENNRGGEYVGNTEVRVYVDYNYDGYFIPTEEVTEFVNDGNMLDIQIDGMGPCILPYKLEVSDTGNECRRDSVQGYFELGSTTKDGTKVLQITEKKDDNTVNLQKMFDKVENSMLAGYLHSAETMLNMELYFETVTASQLETRLAENARYLEQWDIVVLTLDGLGSSLPAGALDAINQYVGGGRSLLVCGQDPGEQRAGLSGALLGQTDGRTFVNIGAAGTGAKLRYADLKPNMFGEQAGLKAEPVNDGSIFFYPYVIDNGFTFGALSNMKASPYLLDFDNNLKSESKTASFVTAWYTLGSDSRTGSAYGISPKDARNNYYCYSRGNVVYLAQSEYPYITDEKGTPSPAEEGSGECRFFVNALFAAYNAGLHNAHINIVSGFSADAADIESISVPFDEAWLEVSDEATGGILDNTVDVFFKFRDNNVVKYKSTEVNFYREASAEESGIYLDDVSGMEGVKLLPFESEIWTVIDNRLVQVAKNDMQPGQVYRIKAPVITLQNLRNNETENKADIYIVMRTTFVKNGKPDDIVSFGVVSMNRARLFRLE